LLKSPPSSLGVMNEFFCHVIFRGCLGAFNLKK
jgi:hypothetical protein